MTETVLWVDNTEPLYRRKRYMFCNLYLKHAKGKFDEHKAKKLFRYLTTEANKDYKKQIGEPLPISDRREAERVFVHEFKEILRTPSEVKYLKADCVKSGRREKAFRNG